MVDVSSILDEGDTLEPCMILIIGYPRELAQELPVGWSLTCCP